MEPFHTNPVARKALDVTVTSITSFAVFLAYREKVAAFVGAGDDTYSAEGTATYKAVVAERNAIERHIKWLDGIEVMTMDTLRDLIRVSQDLDIAGDYAAAHSSEDAAVRCFFSAVAEDRWEGDLLSACKYVNACLTHNRPRGCA